MAGYTMQGSYSTVQVKSPTLVLPVQYCTIQTDTHGVIASFPVSEQDFTGGYADQVLTDFASGIEYLMRQPHVIGAVGSQTIDTVGLLADTVVFTVEYRDPVLAPNGITAEAPVDAQLIYGIPRAQETGGAIDALNPIVTAYDNLKAAAGG